MSIHTASGFTSSDAVIAAINVGTTENGISAYASEGSIIVSYNSKRIVLLKYSNGSNSGFRVGGAYGDGTSHYIYLNNGSSTWSFDKEINTPPGGAYYTAITVTTTAKGLYLDYTIYYASNQIWHNTVWIVIGRDNNPQYFVHNDYTGSATICDRTIAYNLTIDKKKDYKPRINNTTCTSIANWCTAGDTGQYTVMEDLFFYVCRQYPNAGIIELNGNLYYTDGTTLLLDGPMG